MSPTQNIGRMTLGIPLLLFLSKKVWDLFLSHGFTQRQLLIFHHTLKIQMSSFLNTFEIKRIDSDWIIIHRECLESVLGMFLTLRHSRERKIFSGVQWFFCVFKSPLQTR